MDVALSIIIPVARGETLWRALLPRLNATAADEVIIAAAEQPPADWQAFADAGARWLQCPHEGRAAVMNAAARAARRRFLWFVHADSRPDAHALQTLRRAIARAPTALHYFALRFYDGGARMRVNEFGVWLRCRLFANPFGDQALSLPRALFWRLGGYDESAAYGEDHLLVLRARRRGLRVVAVAAAVQTSARRYVEHGWWNTVCLYQRLWWRQWKQ